MTILNGSRYQQNVVDFVVSEGIGRQTIEHRYPVTTVVTFSYYEWTEGDRIDLVAASAFGDPTLWWKIADANPEIMDWTSIEFQTAIRIPDAY